MRLNLGHLRSKSRSLGQIKEIPSRHPRSYNLYPVDQFSSQLGNKCGITVSAQMTRKLGQIHIARQFDSGELSRAIMTLLYSTRLSYKNFPSHTEIEKEHTKVNVEKKKAERKRSSQLYY